MISASTDTGLVSTQFLADHLGAPGLVILDATWTAKARRRMGLSFIASAISRARAGSIST